MVRARLRLRPLGSARFGCPNPRREPSQAMRAWDWALLGASCVNAVAISWAGINAQAYVTATTFMVLTNV